MSDLTKQEILSEASNYLDKWDNQEEVICVEMGGLGDDYELAIQSLVMEMLRDCLDKEIVTDDFETDEELEKFGNILSESADRIVDDWHFSGAQVGAAKNVVGKFLKDGVRSSIEEMRELNSDRLFTLVKPDNLRHE